MNAVDLDDSVPGVRQIVFDRPEARNALRRADFEQLTALLHQADSDAEVRVVLLRGAGATFCAGGDVKETSPSSGGLADHPVHAATDCLAGLANPVVAAVHGAAVGFGMTMLLHADFVVAGPHAVFSAPFVRMGVAAEAGSSELLPRLVGARTSARMLLLGEKLTGEQAFAEGLVSHFAPGPPEAVLEAALRICTTLAALPAAALRANKLLLREGCADAVAGARERELTALLALVGE